MLPKCENAQLRSISREADLAWLAGIIDGEGCLSVDVKMAANGKMYIMPKVRVINTDVRMIQKCSRIYAELNIVYYYNINKKRKDHYKDQLAIIVSSQGSSVKVLKAIIPYLANKQEIAGVMVEIIELVQSLPKGGNTSSYNYINDESFKALMAQWNDVRAFHIEPSTTERKAREVISW